MSDMKGISKAVEEDKEIDEKRPDEEKSLGGSCSAILGLVFFLLLAINVITDGWVTDNATNFLSTFLTPTASSHNREVGATPTWRELKASASEIPYETLFRYAEDHVGKLFFFRGQVFQVGEEDNDFRLLVHVTQDEYGFWDDTIFLMYRDAPLRILEDDIISFVGRMNGTITYESVLGADITVPAIEVLSLIIESE